ncbi:unnamed protein product [Urochloa decumbens]|uniref:Uncharacterized protein n=1 Tax=Urochloa decumbens TaxID=240449 RepID=A0ABC8VYB4_9POAL
MLGLMACFVFEDVRHTASSWAECDLVVAVAAASMGLGVITRKQVCVGATGAPAHQANAGAAGEGHANVIAIDHGDVVEVLVAAAAYGELGQRHRRLPGERAGECAGAVAGRAPPAVAVEGAPRAAPHPAGARAGRHAEGPCSAGVELRAPADWGGRRPHGESAVVSYREGGRVGTGCSKGSEEQEEDRGRGSH